MSMLFTKPQWDKLTDNEQNKMVYGIFDNSSIIGEI